MTFLGSLEHSPDEGIAVYVDTPSERGVLGFWIVGEYVGGGRVACETLVGGWGDLSEEVRSSGSNGVTFEPANHTQ